jgi:DNA-binding response OmpR family regulator
MELSLVDDEPRLLRDFLRDHLQQSQFEVARTKTNALRDELLARLQLIERLLV